MSYKNLFALQELSDTELNQLLEVAAEMKRIVLSRVKRGPQLLGKVLAVAGDFDPITLSALTLSVQYLSGISTIATKQIVKVEDILALKACGADFVVTSAEAVACQTAAKSISGGIIRFGNKTGNPLKLLAVLLTIFQRLETLNSIDVSVLGDVQGEYDFVEDLCAALLRYESRVSIFVPTRNMSNMNKYKNLRVYNDISMTISGADFIVNLSGDKYDSTNNAVFYGDEMGLTTEVVKLAQQNVPMLFSPALFDKEMMRYTDYVGNMTNEYYANLTASTMAIMYLLNRN